MFFNTFLFERVLSDLKDKNDNRSSHPEEFIEKCILKKCSKFTG